MADLAMGSGGNGVAFLMSGALVYGTVAAACSSPQTAEINAHRRSSTLMKWVHLGQAQAFLFVVIAAMIDKKHALPILAGGGLAMGIMYGSYFHAKKAGLASVEPGTED